MSALRGAAQWRLAPGVSSGLWDYVRADHIADEYDEYFAYNQLFQYDLALLLAHFRRPGTLVDLGCGSGRLLVPFAERGFHAVGVDLSLPMLRVVGRKAAERRVPIDRVLANLVQLDCIGDATADYCTCMFSTLGMICESRHRRAVVRHARRMLKPGGKFAIHVHNRWYNVFDPDGRRWLAGTLLARLRRDGLEPGDKVFDYRGIPNVRLHLFTKRELVALLRDAGFGRCTLIPLNTERQRPLRAGWWWGGFRANGWIALCEA